MGVTIGSGVVWCSESWIAWYEVQATSHITGMEWSVHVMSWHDVMLCDEVPDEVEVRGSYHIRHFITGTYGDWSISVPCKHWIMEWNWEGLIWIAWMIMTEKEVRCGSILRNSNPLFYSQITTNSLSHFFNSESWSILCRPWTFNSGIWNQFQIHLHGWMQILLFLLSLSIVKSNNYAMLRCTVLCCAVLRPLQSAVHSPDCDENIGEGEQLGV